MEDNKTIQEKFVIFPKIVDKPPVGINVTKDIISNGDHILTYLNFLTLEVTMLSTDKKKIIAIEPNFKVAWLCGEVINSFFYTLTKNVPHILYICSTTALSIGQGKPFRRLWNGTNLDTITKILIPFNPNGSHWILIVCCIKNKTIAVLDPLRKKLNLCDKDTKRAFDIGCTVLEKKFGIQSSQLNLNLDHTFQNDFYNCGVFVSYYAKQIVKGKALQKVFYI